MHTNTSWLLLLFILPMCIGRSLIGAMPFPSDFVVWTSGEPIAAKAATCRAIKIRYATDDDVSALLKLNPKVEHLDLSALGSTNGVLSSKSVDMLVGLSNVKSLLVSGNPNISLRDVARLMGIETLEYLACSARAGGGSGDSRHTGTIVPALGKRLRGVMLEGFSPSPQFYMALFSAPLEIVEIEGCGGMTADVLSLSSKAQTLVELSLTPNERLALDAATLERFAQLPKLRRLTLYRFSATDAGFQLLTRSRTIKELGAGVTGLSERALFSFGAMTQLECYSGALPDSLSDELIDTLNKLPKLKYLDLLFTRVTSRGLSALQLPDLEELRVRLNSIEGDYAEQVNALTHFSKLKNLVVHASDYHLKDRLVPAVAALRTLKCTISLKIHTSRISKPLAKALGDLRTLDSLWTEVADVEPGAFEHLGEDCSVTDLTVISAKAIEKPDMAALSKLRQLKMLSINAPVVLEDLLQSIKSSGGIECLVVTNAIAGTAKVQDLSHWKSLRTISLWSMEGTVGRVLLRLAESAPRLECIDLFCAEIATEEVDRLVKSLKEHCPCLRYLDFDSSRIGTGATRCLREMSSLRFVGYGSAILSDQGIDEAMDDLRDWQTCIVEGLPKKQD